MLRGSTVCAKAVNAQTAIAWFMGFEGGEHKFVGTLDDLIEQPEIRDAYLAA